MSRAHAASPARKASDAHARLEGEGSGGREGGGAALLAASDGESRRESDGRERPGGRATGERAPRARVLDIALAGPQQREAREREREEVDAEHHHKLVDVELRVHAVLPLAREAVAEDVDAEDEHADEAVGRAAAARPALLGHHEERDAERDAARLEVFQRLVPLAVHDAADEHHGDDLRALEQLRRKLTYLRHSYLEARRARARSEERARARRLFERARSRRKGEITGARARARARGSRARRAARVALSPTTRGYPRRTRREVVEGRALAAVAARSGGTP